MAKLSLHAGTTGKRFKLLFRDITITNRKAGLTGLVYNTSGLRCYYHREGDTAATLVTLVTAVVGTYTSGGFKEIDPINMPGLYEFGAPSAMLASGSSEVVAYFRGALNMEDYPMEIELTATDNQVVGVNLLSTGLDAIPVTDPGGLATTFPQMLVQLYRRFFKKSTLTSTQLKTYADDDATVRTTQVVSDDGTTQTQGHAT